MRCRRVVQHLGSITPPHHRQIDWPAAAGSRAGVAAAGQVTQRFFASNRCPTGGVQLASGQQEAAGVGWALHMACLPDAVHLSLDTSLSSQRYRLSTNGLLGNGHGFILSRVGRGETGGVKQCGVAVTCLRSRPLSSQLGGVHRRSLIFLRSGEPYANIGPVSRKGHMYRLFQLLHKLDVGGLPTPRASSTSQSGRQGQEARRSAVSSSHFASLMHAALSGLRRQSRMHRRCLACCPFGSFVARVLLDNDAPQRCCRAARSRLHLHLHARKQVCG